MIVIIIRRIIMKMKMINENENENENENKAITQKFYEQ